MAFHLFESGKQTLSKISGTIRQEHNRSDSRSLHITGATGIFSILLGLGKIISGIVSLSVFACMNGCYTLGMALARYCALVGLLQKDKDAKRNSYFYYRLSGIVMVAASLLYVAYSLWTIWHPKTVYYGEIIAITIATIAFAEIGMNLRGVLKYRKAKLPVLHCLKTISLGTSLISLVLTQAAILAFADDVQNPSVNGLLGSIMGGVAALLGIYMIWRISKMEIGDNVKRRKDESPDFS